MRVLRNIVRNWNKWIIWLFPASAVFLVGHLAIEYWQERGPLVTIEISEALNIEPKKTKLKYLGIEIGEVTGLNISDDKSSVLVDARLHRKAASFASEGSQFIFVYPKVTLDGITGLETLVGGSYIRVIPGSGGEKFNFVGTSSKSYLGASTPTVKYSLKSTLAGSLSEGTPVFFRDFKVGVVSDIDIGAEGNVVLIDIVINEKYAKYIRKNTIFWTKKAVKAEIQGFNAKFEIGSAEAILKGGIAFVTPNLDEEVSPPGTIFSLESDIPSDIEHFLESQGKKHKETISYKLKSDSLEGLSVGAPVTYRGLEIGAISSVALNESGKYGVAKMEVDSQYSRLIKEGSIFFKNKAVSAKISSFDARLEVSSLQELLRGGIQFITPEGKSKLAQPGHIFDLQSHSPDNLREMMAHEETQDVKFNLYASFADSLNPKDKIYYRGLKVGEIDSIDFVKDSQGVVIKLSIENRYAYLVRTKTFFWKRKGMKAELGWDGASVEVESLETLLGGGLTFATPNAGGPKATEGTKFYLSLAPPEGWETWSPDLTL